jgi:hypothetical protein
MDDPNTVIRVIPLFGEDGASVAETTEELPLYMEVVKVISEYPLGTKVTLFAVATDRIARDPNQLKVNRFVSFYDSKSNDMINLLI